MRILFVCTGNICRSPMAEGVLRRRLAEAGLDAAVEVDSAATHSYHLGDPPDGRAIATAAKRGYDISAQRARLFRSDDFADFDLILVMDRSHLRLLSQSCPPSYEPRLRLLGSYLARPGEDLEVPDPYYGDLGDYEQALDLVEAGCAALIEALRAARP
jgi:protein-tyrosine phosphatase